MIRLMKVLVTVSVFFLGVAVLLAAAPEPGKLMPTAATPAQVATPGSQPTASSGDKAPPGDPLRQRAVKLLDEFTQHAHAASESLGRVADEDLIQKATEAIAKVQSDPGDLDAIDRACEAIRKVIERVRECVQPVATDDLVSQRDAVVSALQRVSESMTRQAQEIKAKVRPGSVVAEARTSISESCSRMAAGFTRMAELYRGCPVENIMRDATEISEFCTDCDAVCVAIQESKAVAPYAQRIRELVGLKSRLDGIAQSIRGLADAISGIEAIKKSDEGTEPSGSVSHGPAGGSLTQGGMG